MECPPDNQPQKEKSRETIHMGLTPFESRVFEASLSKNWRALELLSQH